MGVHPSGDGAAWDALEAIDVDQPHGLDYRSQQHLAIGVRKRIKQEHSEFADTTAGGIHKPGGSAVLGIEDGTGPIVADGTLRGRGIVWDNTSRLWCWTAAAGVSAAPVAGVADWTILKIHPDKQWGGADVTWAGAHEFDASVDISGNVAMDGDLTVDGNVKIDGNLLVDNSVDFSAGSFASDVSIAEHLACGSSVEVAGDFSVDGTTVVQDFVLTGDSTFTFDPIAGVTGPTFNILGDWSLKAQDVTYTARTDGFVTLAYDTQVIGTVFIETPVGSAKIANHGSSADRSGVSCLVKKGNTWAARTDPTTTAATVYWLPFGDNT